MNSLAQDDRVFKMNSLQSGDRVMGDCARVGRLLPLAHNFFYDGVWIALVLGDVGGEAGEIGF